jgi:hypothetical protein
MSLTLIDITRYKSLIEQSCSCTIKYFDRPDSFCDLVTWPTTISDDTLAFLFYICNIANYTQNSQATMSYANKQLYTYHKDTDYN